MNERDIVGAIRTDATMMDRLRLVARLGLPDWAIGAGFVRGKVWDLLHGFAAPTPLDDVDVLYFRPLESYAATLDVLTAAISARKPNPVWAEEDAIEQRLAGWDAATPWSVRNQARMHIGYGVSPYRSTADAIAHWVETPTCVAATLDSDAHVRLIAPYGIDDLIAMVIRPTPGLLAARPDAMAIFGRRVMAKNWPGRWPKVRIGDRN